MFIFFFCIFSWCHIHLSFEGKTKIALRRKTARISNFGQRLIWWNQHIYSFFYTLIFNVVAECFACRCFEAVVKMNGAEAGSLSYSIQREVRSKIFFYVFYNVFYDFISLSNRTRALPKSGLPRIRICLPKACSAWWYLQDSPYIKTKPLLFPSGGFVSAGASAGT